jgi:hypothetical protein
VAVQLALLEDRAEGAIALPRKVRQSEVELAGSPSISFP